MVYINPRMLFVKYTMRLFLYFFFKFTLRYHQCIYICLFMISRYPVATISFFNKQKKVKKSCHQQAQLTSTTKKKAVLGPPSQFFSGYDTKDGF